MYANGLVLGLLWLVAVGWFLGCCLFWVLFGLRWSDLVFTMFYCLIGTPGFPWLVFWCFAVNVVVLYWWVWADVAGCGCWICYLGVMPVGLWVVACALRLACCEFGFGVYILCRCFDLDVLWVLR